MLSCLPACLLPPSPQYPSKPRSLASMRSKRTSAGTTGARLSLASKAGGKGGAAPPPIEALINIEQAPPEPQRGGRRGRRTSIVQVSAGRHVGLRG